MSIMKYSGVRSLYSGKDMVVDKKPFFMNETCVECCFSTIRATPDLDGKIRDAWRCALYQNDTDDCQIMRIINYYDGIILKEHMKEKDKERTNTSSISTGNAYVDEHGNWHFHYGNGTD